MKPEIIIGIFTLSGVVITALAGLIAYWIKTSKEKELYFSKYVYEKEFKVYEDLWAIVVEYTDCYQDYLKCFPLKVPIDQEPYSSTKLRLDCAIQGWKEKFSKKAPFIYPAVMAKIDDYIEKLNTSFFDILEDISSNTLTGSDKKIKELSAYLIEEKEEIIKAIQARIYREK